MLKHINKGGVPVDYDRLVEYNVNAQINMDILGVKLLSKMNMSGKVFDQALFKTWVKKNNLIVGFNLTPSKTISLGDESIESFINTNAYGTEVTEIVKLFREYKKESSQVLQIPSILGKYKPSGLESADGRRLILVKPNVEPQNTGRFGLVQPALMNLPRFMKDLNVAPKGWTLLTADSGQIEPKLIYGFYIPDKQIQKLIELYGDAYYAVLHYCTMPLSDIKNQIMDFKLFEITSEIKELRQKLKTYGNGVMYGSTYNPEKDPLKQSYIERIGQHPLRIEWEQRLYKKLLSGQKMFPTLFGTNIDIYKSDKYINATTDTERDLALKHCMINNPIQGTAGDLMGFSLKASDDLINKKAPNSWITKFVHDEDQFCIYNKELDYVLEELSGHTSYNINDTVRIFNEPKIGRTINENVPCSYASLYKGC